MTTQEAKRQGGIQALKGAAVLLVIFELTMLYTETTGDVANGILFFIAAQLNIVFLLLGLLHFLIMYVMGRQAGFDLLIKNKPGYKVGLLTGLVVSLIVVLVQSSLLLLFRSHDLNNSNREIGLIAIRNFFILLIPELPVWLWMVHTIRTKTSATQIRQGEMTDRLEKQEGSGIDI